jgi:cellulose 1,4-beta-cellobiosidase
MNIVAGYPTAVWMDKMAAITGGSANGGRLGLAQHITAALAQQTGNQPVVVTLVIYDLPQRDCAALASNGEISIAPNPPTQPLTGIQTYEQNYITPIFNILAPYANNPNIRFVLVIEPDSLPNLVTNTGLSFAIPACIAANGGQTGSASVNGVYVQGIQYALNQFHTLPNVYQYLDIGHSAWLGWPSNLGPAVSFYSQVVRGTSAGFSSIDGFISNTANYTPTREPFMTANESIGGNQVLSANFYQYNPYIDEADYDQALYTAFTNAGFPASIGFLIDTSRNGWGGPNRPTGPSASNDLNTFVNASKIDLRNARGQWCNQSNAGLGTPPTASPPGFFPQLEAFVWIKPPGESDGTYASSSAYVGGNADENCDPLHINALANNTLTGSLANPPSAGLFFPSAFTMLVQNALPAVPVTPPAGGTGGGGTTGGGTTGGGGTTAPTPSYTLSASPSSLSVAQGASGMSTITVAPSGGFAGSVAFALSGVPSGVTATFAPTSSTTSTQLTLAAGASAATGLSVMTVTGISGTTLANTTVALTVTPTTVTPPGGGGTTTGGGGTTTGGGGTTTGGGGTTTGGGGTTTGGGGTTTGGGGTTTGGGGTTTGGGGTTASGSGPATATGAVGTSGAWFDQDNVALTTPTSITALTLTITVPQGNVALNGIYNTVGGQIVNATTTAGGNIVYTFTLKAGQQMWPGSYTFAAQMNGNGAVVHNAAGDTWTLTYTAGGVTYAQSGTI